jgi:glycerophosphoryl diester phosphodiesterase
MEPNAGRPGRRRGWTAGLLVTALLVLTACGDDADTATPAETTAAPTTTAAPLVPPPGLGEDPDPVVIGHRGAAGHHPDNSLEGFAAARDLGATWVELDTRISADGDVFLSHDPETAGGLVVAESTSADLAAEGLPTLVEALEVIDEHALGVDVEIKSVPWEPGFDPQMGMVDATMAALRARPIDGPVVVSSFNRDALDRVRELTDDDYDTVLILPAGAAGPDQVAPLVEGGHDGLALEGPDITAAVVTPFTDAGLPVWSWTIDDPDDAEALVTAGVTGIITDVPDVISDALAA